MIDRLNSRGGRYKFERRKPFDAKKWQEQLRTQQKQNRTSSRTATKDKVMGRIRARKEKALRREEKARRKQSKDDKASGLTDAGRRFLDNQQRVADQKSQLVRNLQNQKPRQPSRNVTSTVGI
jgi:alpha-galactosidase/6-phospho-beta-glucosidase family protein